MEPNGNERQNPLIHGVLAGVSPRVAARLRWLPGAAVSNPFAKRHTSRDGIRGCWD